MPDNTGSGPIRLRLKKREERRLEAGHLWVFSNEVDVGLTPLKGIAPGSPVILESATGKFLAHAYVNPASLICARVTSRNKAAPFDSTQLAQRLRDALSLRESLYSEPFYRLVHSEGDFLPGLTVDRYGDVLVVQITTAGMEKFKQEILATLVEITEAKSVCLQNESPMRELEGLEQHTDWVHGAEVTQLRIRENDLEFVVPTEFSQKTGWFFDHRESRKLLRNFVEGKRVLDLYSYIGGFGLNAANAGASDVWSIDASESAAAAARENAVLNGLNKNYRCDAADAVETMRSMFTDGERFDVVVLDPPAFIKRKKDKDAGVRHYALNNKLALKLLNPGGILLSASCSQAFSLHELQQSVRAALPKGLQGVQVLNTFQQAPDHPVNIAVPESLYLKGLIARLH